ncbi:hypothetical protein BDZ97DRAFT_1649208 [Flammula alnicola]|nr:hypothetical protein BDZ97DRAFT_1649208 [Flammula alnicola]
MSAISNKLDPYTSQCQDHNPTLQEKIDGLKEIIKSTQTAMLTTRSADGQFHARAMNPVAPDSEMQLTLNFIANNASHKFEELQNDSHVNVCFLHPATTNWASFSGKATIMEDRDEIKKHWSSRLSAWFGDLKDGVHKGDVNDPRIALIQVIPDEIRYWHSTKSKIGTALEVKIDSVTGKVAAPGELRTITSDEIQLTQGLNSKK